MPRFAWGTWSGAAFGGSTQGGRKPSPGIPVPDFTAVYYWAINASGAPWAGGAWAGGGKLGTSAIGGLLAAPDGDSGTVTITAWWANATYLNLSRVLPDGTRQSVRDATPFMASGVTRTNMALNPRVRDDTDGYTPGTGAPTLSQVTGYTVPDTTRVTTALRATAKAAGKQGVTFTYDAVPPYQTQLGFWLRSDIVPTSAVLSIQWLDRFNSIAGTTTYALDAGTAQSTVGPSWTTVTVDSSPNGAMAGTATVLLDGYTVGQTFEITGRLWEVGTLQGRYFDGDFPGGNWIGTNGKSASTRAPLNYVVDRECPQDIAVRYELTNASVPGYVAGSDPVKLDSGGFRSWLTHPAYSDMPVSVEVLGPFGDLDRDIQQGVFYPLDSDDGLPIVVTASGRRGRTGTIQLLAINHEERDRLLRYVQDGSPLLIRPPASYGEGPSLWLSLGKVTETNRAAYSENPFRVLKADFYEVQPPIVETYATSRLGS